MTSSASSPVSLAIAGYVAGRVEPGRLVALVSAAYYGDGGTLKDSLAVEGKGDGLVGRALAAIRRLFSGSA